jgi:hypothetical protein
LPAVKGASWVRTPIDRFILAKLEAESLRPAAAADRRALVRRATFDLTGLPPTPEDVEAFVADNSADAFAKVVDRLLSSPHYGERWGRYWLDVARYAEDQAHTFAVKPNTNAYRYRDWVIDALNRDVPFDQFVKLQIAADLLDLPDAERMRHLPALGFFGLGAQYYKNTDTAKALADELDDRVDTLSRGFLGLTVSCARCHDHKFDPIPQQDYYSLAGIFQSCKLSDVYLAPKELGDRYQEGQAKLKQIENEAKAFAKAEKIAVAQQNVGTTAKYMLAAWRSQVGDADGKKRSMKVIAERDGLSTDAVGRWVKFLRKPPAATAFDSCRAMFLETAPANAARVESAARDFQEQLEAAVAAKVKGKMSKQQTDLFQGFFNDDKGPALPSDSELYALLSPEKKQQYDRHTSETAKVKASYPAVAPPSAHGLTDAAPKDMNVFLRGNPAKLGEIAPRRFLQVLSKQDAKSFTHGSGRLELAEAIASRDNPLTARVIVNRLWQRHFGKGLVGTTSNFGELGERPSHPELLDYLACRLMDAGWSLKAVHREIMLSAVYQTSAEADADGLTRDADNRWFGRHSRSRLDVEAWRDAMLAVSGTLDRTQGGPTFNLNDANIRRRTVYAKISRHDLNATLRLFDFPDANITSERRTETTVPQQQLFVLNSPFIVDSAKAFAKRLEAGAKTDAERVQRAFYLAVGRPATAEETQLALTFLAGADSAADSTEVRLTRWERLAQAILAGNEFMYVD